MSDTQEATPVKKPATVGQVVQIAEGTVVRRPDGITGTTDGNGYVVQQVGTYELVNPDTGDVLHTFDVKASK